MKTMNTAPQAVSVEQLIESHLDAACATAGTGFAPPQHLVLAQEAVFAVLRLTARAAS